METIAYNVFESVDIRLGTVIAAELFERAKKPALKVTVDFGLEVGIKVTSSQIAYTYRVENLIGKQVLGCINLGKKNIAGFQSDFLLLGCPNQSGHIILVSPDFVLPNGARLF